MAGEQTGPGGAGRSGVLLRAARVEDADSLGRLRVLVWRAAYAGILPADYLAGLDATASIAAFDERIRRAAVSTVVAERAGLIRGYAVAGPARDGDSVGAYEIQAIYVHPDDQRQGIGSALLTAVIARAERPGRAYLWVAAGNASAIAFYRRHAFRADGASRRHRPSGARLVRMIRKLD